MKQMIAIAALTLAASGAAAEDAAPPGLMEQGAQMFLQGLMQEMGPKMDDLQGLAEQVQPRFEDMAKDLAGRMGPAIAGLMAAVDDIGNYDLPTVLDNGDILIRRKPDAPPYVRPAPSDGIDL